MLLLDSFTANKKHDLHVAVMLLSHMSEYPWEYENLKFAA